MLMLDTNVYLDVSADAAVANEIALLIEGSGDEVGISSIVLSELLIGVEPQDRARLVACVTAGIDSEAVVTPSHADWISAGDALRELGGGQATKGRSFWNDLLIAASCLRVGATLVTRNADDFRRIRRVLPLRVHYRSA